MPRTDRRLPLLLALTILVTAPGCTLVKPVICSVAHPWHRVETAIALYEEDDDPQDLPAAFSIPTTFVLLPPFLAMYSIAGIVGGFTSGLASDLNVLVGNAEWDWDDMNMTRIFKTNAKIPEED